MGREIKRVDINFDWPLEQVWEGYLNPFYTADKCPACGGSGYSPEAKFLYDQWYGNEVFTPDMTGSVPFDENTPEIRALAERNVGQASFDREVQRLLVFFNGEWCHHLDQKDVDALVEEDRLWDFTKHGIPNPTAEEVNHWSLLGFGHDSINAWICVREKAQRLGFSINCSQCNGEGILWSSSAAKWLYESWQNIEPPTGEGWQVWENVSEGSPVSPVFATKEELISWLIEQGHSQQAAENFVGAAYSPSMMMDSRGIKGTIDCME